MFNRIKKVLGIGPKPQEPDTSIYSSATFSRAILNEGVPIISGKDFPMEGKISIEDEQQFNPGVMVLPKPDPGN